MTEGEREFYSTMSNFELSELSIMLVSTLQDQLALFASVLFAYLATAYFAGKNLSRTEAIAASGVYLVFQLQFIFSYFQLSQNAATLIEYITGVDTSYNTIWIIGAQVIIMVLSLIYMSRKSAQKDT